MSDSGKFDPASIEENIDAIVDYLLRDQDFLITKEIRQKIEELNQLLISAHGQRLKVDFSIIDTEMPSGGKVSLLDTRVYKRI